MAKLINLAKINFAGGGSSPTPPVPPIPPADGKTRVYINLPAGYLKPFMDIYINGTINIDWGDETSGSVQRSGQVAHINHEYNRAGKYVITIEPLNQTVFYFNAYSTGYTPCIHGNGVGDVIYQNTVTEIELGKQVAKVASYSFFACYSLEKVIIGENVTEIEERAFQNCYFLNTVIFSNRVTSIGNYAFIGCSSLLDIVIPNSVTSIGNGIFDSCTVLKRMEIPQGVTSIGSSVFSKCRALTEVLLPQGITNIGASAFGYCEVLLDVVIKEPTPPNLGSNVFINVSYCRIYVPAASVDTYKAASGWSTYASRIQAIPE